MYEEFPSSIASNLILINHCPTFFFFWQARLNGLGGSHTLIHVLKASHYNLISWAKATVSIDFGFSHPWNHIMKLWWSLIIKDFGVTKTWHLQLNGHVNKEPSGPDTWAWFRLICCFRLAATRKDKLTCPEKHNSATDKKSVISQYFPKKGTLQNLWANQHLSSVTKGNKAADYNWVTSGLRGQIPNYQVTQKQIQAYI